MLNVILFAVALLAYMILAGWLRKRAITGQMFFVIVGFGASLLGMGEIDFSDASVRLIGELALVFLLFSHALLMDFRALKVQAQSPITQFWGKQPFMTNECPLEFARRLLWNLVWGMALS